MLDFETVKPILEAVGMAEATDQSVDLDATAKSLEIEVDDLVEQLERAQSCGLVLLPPDGCRGRPAPAAPQRGAAVPRPFELLLSTIAG